MTHEFFGTGAVVPTAQEAMMFATERLRQSFSAVQPAAAPAAARRGATRARQRARS